MRFRGEDGPGDCRWCREFLDDPQALEDALPGIYILSSAWGSTRGNSGICRVTGRFQQPQPACAHFRPRERRFVTGKGRVTAP